MTEHHLRVQRTARYHMLGNASTAEELWVVVHGYGQLGRFFLNNFNGMESNSRCIVAPEALSRFYLDSAHSRVGATWMTREERLLEVDDHVAYLDALVAKLMEQAPQGLRVKALGFSQGVATVSRWALKGNTKLLKMILWAGSLPPELDQQTLSVLRNIHVDLVLGDRDEYAKAGDLEAMDRRLELAGVPRRSHRFSGTHKLEPVLLERLLDRA